MLLCRPYRKKTAKRREKDNARAAAYRAAKANQVVPAEPPAPPVVPESFEN